MSLLAIAGCHAQEDSFYEKVFTCSVGAPNSCGTTRDGAPMTCFAGSQLGGDDFCVPSCDPAVPSPDPGSACLPSGVLLHVCHPDASKTDPAQGCPADLQCYRTDLLFDDGLCMKMRLCTEDSDCTGDPRRRACAATIARGLYPALLGGADNLQCVQPNCKTLGSSCAPGESCLADFLSRGSDFPEICVPNCDANLHCPPNFACSVSPTPAGPAAICVPALLGSRCNAEQDCSTGSCLDTGAGFSECLLPLPCQTDEDCAFLDGFLGAFVCADGVPGQRARCVALNPFHGVDCLTSSDCPAGQDCFVYSPFEVSTTQGECRVPCDADLACPNRGGVPHVCVGDGQGGCYPSDFALPCQKAEDCRSGLSCVAAPPNPQSVVTSGAICTTACTTDDDCANLPAIHGLGFCERNLCRSGGQQGAPCDRDAQCRRHLCSSGTCLD